MDPRNIPCPEEGLSAHPLAFINFSKKNLRQPLILFFPKLRRSHLTLTAEFQR